MATVARRPLSPTAAAGSHGGSPTRLPAAATTAARSTWRATNAVIASTAARARRPYSTAVTRPRCLVGSSNSAVARNGAQHRHAGLLACLPQHVLMPGRPDSVEDHTGDPGCGVERGKPVQQCGDAVALAACIDHQDHRGAEQTGDVRGGARRRRGRGGSDAPVEQAHHSFDHGDVRAAGAVGVQRANELLPHQYRVEVAAGPPRGQRVVAGVDEVRAHLERRDRMAGLPQGTDQTRCDRGLSAARRGAGAAGTTHVHGTASGHHAREGRITTRCPSGPCVLRPSGV